ncbi:hypothetical protein ABMA27_014721 [Loxostege sticticalis]|uniref:Chitin-binding type-2 domain-containing protein n=1 Tax=Loxostege sticticalis TaxID=481309 RepID=A0ABR3I9Z8_LOXSC
MGLKLAGFLLSLLLVLPVRTDLSTNGTLSEGTRGPRASRRVVRLYSGTRPKPIVCLGEGFQADPTDCSIFHRCMKNGNGRYVSFKFQCGPGTIYDTDKEICNHPQSTKRTECGASIHVPSVEVPFDNEISREVPSPLSTKYPESTEKTATRRLDASSFASKNPGITTSLLNSNSVLTTLNSLFIQQKQTKSPKASSIKREATASSYSTTPLSMSPQKMFSTTAKVDFQNSAFSSLSGDICTTNGFMGDSENCRKFYRCISNQRGGFIRYEFLCTDPTIWDDDKQACNHVWAVKRRRCGRGSLVDESHEIRKNNQEPIPESTSTTKTTSLPKQSQLQINYGSKITQSQTQISHGAVIQNQTQINFGNGNKNVKPGVVQNQTQISHGDALSQTQTQINYGDEAVQTQLQIDHSKESSQAQTQVSQLSSTTKTTQFNEYKPVPSTSSNNGCTESGFIGDSEDCKKFYRCVDNGRGSFTRYEFSCGEGTVWDSKIEACNHAWAVKECGGKSPSESTTQSSIKTTQSTTKVSESLSTLSTTTTTTTQSNNPSTETESEDDNDIPFGNQPSSPSTNKPTEQVTSGNKEPHSSGDNKCRSSGFMGDNKDCKKFYRCVDNGNGGYTRYEFTCGEGTVWDQRIEACNHVWAVEKCGGNANVDNQTEKSTTANVIHTTTTQTTSQIPLQNDDYDTGYGQQPLHDEPSSTITTTTIKSTTTTLQSISSSETSVGNTCTSSGFMGDNVDCKKFYRCVDNGNGGYTRYEFSCGEGTVWDPKIQACNHAWAVEKCGGNSEEDINKVDTTTRKQDEVSSSSTQAYEPDDNNDPGYGQQSQEPQPVSSTTSHQEGQILETNECKTSGFMGDSNDCKKFYRCVDNGDETFTRFEFSCGEGTVWDSKIDTCNHAWAVEKCGGTSTSSTSSPSSPTQLNNEGNSGSYPIQSDEYSTQTTLSAATSTTTTTTTTSSNTANICKNSGFMGDTQDCKKFYRCVDDGHGGYTRYEFGCGEGTVWDQSIEACNHVWAVSGRCSGSGNYNDSSDIQPTTQTFTTSSEKESQDQDDKPTTQKISTSTGITSKPSSYKCSQEGFYGDPNDCKKFYRCVSNGKGDFTKYEFTCGDGTIWDQEILACNHENVNNKCSGSNVNHSATTAMPQLESGSSDTTQQSQTTSPRPGATSTVSGSDQCIMEGFFANTNDCKKFYRCVDNGKDGFTKYDFTCGEGTVWVQEIQACDYENDISSCSSKDSSSKPQTTEELQSTTESSSTSQATTASQSLDKEDDEYPSASSSEPPKTDENCTSEGFFGNKNDCTRFYRCVDNGQGGYTKYDFTCGEGTAWDSNIQTCNHITEVESCQKTNEQSQSKPSQDKGASQTTESTSTTKETSSSENSTSCSSTDKCEKEGYFGNTKDCTMFYRCVDNGKGGYTKYDFTCGEGTIWDQDITTCNHPQDVTNPSCKNCGDGQSSSENSSATESSSSASSSSTDSQSSQGTTESSNQGSNCSQDSSTKKPGSQKIKCEKAGFYADPDDCKKFYRCVDWDGDGKRFSVYHFDCGEGTIWDPQLETCNHEDSVYPPRDCSGTQSQSGNGTQETTSSSSTTTTEKSTTPEQSTTTTQSTTEESTTQQSSSSSEQTTQQLTTTEKTTTQQPSTSEQTTTEQTTTTTQQSTSSEKTTTQQSTTSEKTTTQPTTSEQTTTEQTTTSQQQTTQETTTSQQTSTQQTTSSEQTTTEQTTTSEQTTTQQSTTSELTTQQTMTSEQTTQSSSSEQNTTQQSSTTEDSTTDSTTSEQQSTTTEQSSTTTEQNTTEQQATTEQEKTTTEGSTTPTESSESTTTESSQETSSSEKDCPETEDDQYLFVCPTSFRRHPKYCNMFYQCTEDNDSHDVKIAMFKCPNNTIYDESKTQCVEEDKADKKCDGQTAQRHRVKRLNSNFKEPIEASRSKHTCTTAGYYPFEPDTECSGIFLKCQTTKSGKLRGYVYRCPEGYTYWSISKRCEKNQYMKGCKQSDRSWRDRWEIPIEKKNIAK